MPIRESCINGSKPRERFDVPGPNAFVDEDDATLIYDFRHAPDIRDIARLLIKQRESLKHLKRVDIAYFWKREGGRSGGKATLGRCQKPAGLLKHYAEVSYIIWLAADWCRGFQLTNYQVEALIYHELLHTEKKEDKLSLRPHDFEGFASELYHYGPWNADFESVHRALQPNLFTEIERDEADKGRTPRQRQRATIAPGEVRR